MRTLGGDLFLAEGVHREGTPIFDTLALEITIAERTASEEAAFTAAADAARARVAERSRRAAAQRARSRRRS